MALTRITKGVIKPNENYDTHNINSTGIVTAIGLDVNGNGDISGDLNVGGVLTYEDVTSIDSVGIITAQKGIHVGAGVSAVGVGTFGSLDISGDIDVDGHTNLDNVSIAGVTTISSSDLIVKPPTVSTSRIKLGYAEQMKISVSSSNQNVIQSTAAYLQIANNNINFSRSDTNLTMASFKAGQQCKLGYNYVDRIATSGIGATVYGQFDTTNLTIAGVSTFTGNIDANGDLDVDGHTNLDNVSIAGVTTFAGAIDANGDLDVDGHTNLDNVSIAGVSTFSGDVLVPDKIIHSGDTNTFIRFPDAGDIISMTVGNYEKVKIELGDITITNAHLSLVGDGRTLKLGAASDFQLSHTGTVNKIQSFVGDIDYMSPNGSGHSFQINSQEKLRIASNGKVGINSTAPSNTLDVVGSYHGLGVYRDDFTGNSGAGVNFNLGRAKADGSLFKTATITAVGNDNTGQAGELRFSVLTSGSMDEKVRITSSGSVGIGTNSPTANALTLGGTAAAVICQNPNSGYGTNQGFYFGNGNGTIGYVWNYENDQIRFATNNTERLRIASDGTLTYRTGGGKGYDFGSSGSSASVANMFCPASYTIAFGTNNNERLRINATGYVGIRRENPLSWLHISNGELSGTTNPTSAAAPNQVYDALVIDGQEVPVINMRSRGDGNNAYAALFFSDNVRAAGELAFHHKNGSNTDYWQFKTQANGESLRINSSNQVLIGENSSPDCKLTVTNGTLMIETHTTFYSGSGENGENYPTIFFKGDHSSGNNPAHGKISVRHSAQNTYSGDLVFMPQGYYSGSYGYQEVMRVSAYKRVGINVTPTSTLHVVNTTSESTIAQFGQTSSARYARFNNIPSQQNFDHLLLSRYDNSLGYQLRLQNTDAGGTGQGSAIQFIGHGGSQTGLISVVNRIANSSTARMHFNVSGNSIMHLEHAPRRVMIGEPASAGGFLANCDYTPLQCRPSTGSTGCFAGSSKSYTTNFGLLPWSGGGTYLSSGTTYNNGTWAHQSSDATNCLLYMRGLGLYWYSSDNGSSSWNVAAGGQVMNNTGVWVGGTSSDRRLKDNITNMSSSDALTKVAQLQGVSYTWKDEIQKKYGIGSYPEGTHHGFIAQDVKTVWPDAHIISDRDNESDFDDDPTKDVKDDVYYGDIEGVKLEKMVPLLVEAIKELKKENEALKARVTTLESS